MSSSSTGIQGSIANLLSEWWGGDTPLGSGSVGGRNGPAFAAAANLYFGGNPLYQISDFLAVYPKFGTQPQGITGVTPDSVTPGSGYAVGDRLTVLQPDASGGVLVVDAVDANGAPTAYTIATPGSGYQVTPLVNAIGTMVPTPGDGGLGYLVGDLVAVNQSGAGGGTAQVTSVGAGGVVTGIAIAPAPYTGGSGYAVGGDIPCSGGNGSGLLVNILTIVPYTGSSTQGGTGSGALVNVTQITAPNLVCIPPLVLQMYVNLASACLQAARWLDHWQFAMGLFVAHYATLYIRSEGVVGNSAGQIAASGLTRGIMVSKSAGGVSAGIALPSGLENWGAWTQTEYGTQLATIAKVIGMGAMYVV